MVKCIEDSSPYYHLIGIAATSNMLLSFRASDALNIETCTRFDRSGDEPTAVFLYRVLQETKRGS